MFYTLQISYLLNQSEMSSGMKKRFALYVAGCRACSMQRAHLREREKAARRGLARARYNARESERIYIIRGWPRTRLSFH